MAARVLLIEDDASIARFVELALEELPAEEPDAPAVELRVAGSLAEARTALAEGAWQLVISDLMLPDGSAESLLAEGVALAAGAPPWIVFSAGVHDDRRVALADRGVARVLRKPVPLGELLGTVAELLREAPAPCPVTAAADEADPVHLHFGGDRQMYESFRAGCIQRFADDIMQGDAAVARADAAALRRVAHGLKAVLELIGHSDLAAQARALESAAAGGVPGWPAGWPALTRGLESLGVRRAG
ncbi:Hpt domain-containing protein [Roseateles cellulosilyticus]|uniref:Hpt domain-containing protein n=1 Tax=Pelomonas cellulosilytica TaxID=2906762 RepID=A0ABS8XTQ1_9BURK|nr:Hpt domain-containing protein [Pelomonas sp. P8]MCE4554206.1 Hpt domain-containing protein [Pelomonas sp. P8]